jgi:hypothetical protein
MLVLCMAMLAAVSYMPLLGEDKIGAKSTNGDVMENWKKLAQPGMEHSVLAKKAGSWLITATCYKNGPDKPLTLTGVSEQKMVYDRFLCDEFTIGEGENLFKGTTYISYDNSTKTYQASHIGNMGTALCVMSGEHDAKLGTLIFKSDRNEPGLNNLNVKSRVVITGIIENKYIVSIYQTIGDQPEAQFLEMRYARK